MARSDVACAAAHWQAAAKLSPRNSTYPMELGKLYMANAAEDTHLIRQACQCFETTLNLQPDEVEALLGLANGQYLLNDLENADRNARKALTQSPDFGRTYQLLGEIAIRRDDFQGAYEYANKAIAASPRDLRSTIVLARSLSALGRHTEALSRLNAAIQTTEQPELLELERVTIISRMDGARAALNELQRLADSHPGNFNILSAMARMYLDVGESGNAVTSAQNALNTGTEQTSRNEQANLHLLIGQILRKAGQLDPSIQHLSLAIQLAPDRLEPYLELGQARKERREYQQALQIFEQATQIAPEDPRALFQAGLALKESKDYKSSESMLRRAVSLAPNDLNIRRQLAAVVALNLVHNPRLGRN
jgi:tetratricopeptide (TPR) repeat protein